MFYAESKKSGRLVKLSSQWIQERATVSMGLGAQAGCIAGGL
jgi:hypothetical protein